ncbi:unnamed protein product [Symbiodinium pilosum]|uniref:Sulfotransferase n=1 Tax=Symbiodinium pilosum TaxID=2952 RepID=A0A812RYY9_SYMPI|nr:unnamed protein product [Symbiodinium pilosum]
MELRIPFLAWCFVTLQVAWAEERCSSHFGKTWQGDAEVNEVSFLQMGLQSVVNKRDKEEVLRFMHIPKTGGTSIDSANLHLPPDKRAYDSYMLQTYQRIADSRHLEGQDLGAIFDESHSDMFSYIIFMGLNAGSYRIIPPGVIDGCEDIHTPPSRSAEVALYYQERTTFCAVREPLARYWSAFKMIFYECDPKSVEKRTLSLMTELSTRQYMYNCFFVPQVQSVWGVSNKSAATHQYCHHILHEENLDQEFAELMAEYGQGVELPAAELMSSWTDHCNMSVADLTPPTKAAVYEYFKADYEAFGYAKPDF